MPGPIVSRPLLKKLVVAVLATLTISGTLIFQSGSRVQGDIIPSANNTYDLGSSANSWAEAHIGQASTSRLLVDNGSLSAPSMTFKSASSSGLYLFSANTPAIAAGGTVSAYFQSGKVFAKGSYATLADGDGYYFGDEVRGLRFLTGDDFEFQQWHVGGQMYQTAYNGSARTRYVVHDAPTKRSAFSSTTDLRNYTPTTDFEVIGTASTTNLLVTGVATSSRMSVAGGNSSASLAVKGNGSVTNNPAVGIVNSANTEVISFQANNAVFGPLIQFGTGLGGFDFFNFRSLTADSGTSGLKFTTANAGSSASVNRLIMSGGVATSSAIFHNSKVGISPGTLGAVPTGVDLFVEGVTSSTTVFANSVTTTNLAVTHLTAAAAGATNPLCIGADGTGYIGSSQICPLSAREAKEDLRPISYGLKELMQTNFYDFRNAKLDDNRTHSGPIADETDSFMPNLTEWLNGKINGFDYISFIGVIGRAVQEVEERLRSVITRQDVQAEQIKALQKQIDELKAQSNQPNTSVVCQITPLR